FGSSCLSALLALPCAPVGLAFPCSLFDCSGAHRDLHSFPTRRSSDLHRVAADDREVRHERREREHENPHHDAHDAQSLLHAAPRSEEHTSELQSRENLVCRLLLEKKKKLA